MNTQPLAYLSREFLESDEGRPLRILSEYLDPLRRFKHEKIQDTVVFFGSARVSSRERAERMLGVLERRRDGQPAADARGAAGAGAGAPWPGRATTRRPGRWLGS